MWSGESSPVIMVDSSKFAANWLAEEGSGRANKRRNESRRTLRNEFLTVIT